ncbi:olfactory receptor 10G9-like [Branchiostoma lanceolatum]|uniref:olfactory receptor 10G9-like n=1 Tax=Branchiostoma lanceolatum TaxID=7740 RepID=UPI003457239F
MDDQKDDSQYSDEADITISLGPAAPGLQAAYLVISFIVVLAANSLLILLVCRKDYLRQPRYYLRCHLAVNDMLFTLVQIPRYTHGILQSTSQLHSFSCTDNRIVSTTAVLSTYGVYLLMAIDMYYFICYPLQYETKVTTTRLAMGIGLVDTFSFICGAVPLILVRQADQNISCLMKTRSSQPAFVFRTIGIVAQVISVLIIIGLYYIVLKEAKRQQERDEHRPVKFYKTKGFKTMAPHAIALTTTIITSAFLAISLAQGNAENEEPSMAVAIVEKAAILVNLTVSSMLNPVIYSLRLPEFRRALREMCGRSPTAAVGPAVPSQCRVRVVGVRAVDLASSDVGSSDPSGNNSNDVNKDLPRICT